MGEPPQTEGSFNKKRDNHSCRYCLVSPKEEPISFSKWTTSFQSQRADCPRLRICRHCAGNATAPNPTRVCPLRPQQYLLGPRGAPWTAGPEDPAWGLPSPALISYPLTWSENQDLTCRAACAGKYPTSRRRTASDRPAHDGGDEVQLLQLTDHGGNQRPGAQLQPVGPRSLREPGQQMSVHEPSDLLASSR